MPAEGLPWLDRSEILTLRGDRARHGADGVDGRRRRAADRRRAARAPRLPDARRAPDAGRRPCTTSASPPTATCSSATPTRWSTPAITRFNVSIDSLQRDRFFQITRRDALPQVLRGLEALAEHDHLQVKINAVGIRGFTEDEVIPFARFARERPFEVRFIEFMPLDADHAWTPDSVLTGEEIRAAIDAVHPLVARAARAVGDRGHVPIRRRRGADRLHQPGLRAVLRRLQPHPPDRRGQAAHLPVLAQRDRPARRRCATARPTRSSNRSSATRCGARSSSTTSTSPGSCSLRARCRRSAAERSLGSEASRRQSA